MAPEKSNTEESNTEGDNPAASTPSEGELVEQTPESAATLPAEHQARGGVVAGRARQGMFGVRGSGDTSGFGGLQLPVHAPAPAERPYGGWFDGFTDELFAAMGEHGVPTEAIQQVTVDRGEITYYVRREHLLALCRTLRDDLALRFELCSSVSGVDYGDGVSQQLHSVYHLSLIHI